MKQIPKTIQNRINQASHRLGQQYAIIIRDSVTAQIQQMADMGMNPEDLATALQIMEKSMQKACNAPKG